MADVYLLEVSGGRIRAVFHVDIPAGSATGGLTYQAAYVRSKGGGVIPSILPDGAGDDLGGTIGTAEKAAVGNGSRVELDLKIDLPQDWAAKNGAAKKAYIAAHYTATSVALKQQIKDQFEFYGITSP